jgi:hypothetical protein
MAGRNKSGVRWDRLILGALIAGAICFVSDGFLHQRLLTAQWEALQAASGAQVHEHGGWAVLYFILYEMGRGSLALFSYVLIRQRFGVGPGTAAWAGVVSWLAFSVAAPAQFIPIGYFSNELWVLAAAYQLVVSVLAAIAGAAVYREP